MAGAKSPLSPTTDTEHEGESRGLSRVSVVCSGHNRDLRDSPEYIIKWGELRRSERSFRSF